MFPSFLSWGLTTERVFRGILFKSATVRMSGWKRRRRLEVPQGSLSLADAHLVPVQEVGQIRRRTTLEPRLERYEALLGLWA